MEKPVEYESVDDLISRQNTTMDSLKQTISLIGVQKYFKDDFREIFRLVHEIKDNLELFNKEKDSIVECTARAEECEARAKSLAERVVNVENRLADGFNGKSPDVKMNQSAEMENIMNESLMGEFQLPIRRHLDFVDNSICNSAQKTTIRSKRMQHLTDDEFKSIPGYMRGRVPIDVINGLIDKINECIEEKYKLLSLPKALQRKRPCDVDRCNIYKSQECPETKGKRFFTQDDLKTVIGGKVDKQTLNILTMLRHTKHVKEVRIGGLLRYVNNHYG